MPPTNYYSINVTFDPSNAKWSLYLRNDGAAAVRLCADERIVNAGHRPEMLEPFPVRQQDRFLRGELAKAIAVQAPHGGSGDDEAAAREGRGVECCGHSLGEGGGNLDRIHA